MNKHTPGPWFVDHMEGQMPVGVATADRFPICEMYPGIAGWTAPEPVDLKLANARLIAAAPELLEALQMYAAVVGNTGHAASRQSAAQLYARAHEVIAKATGA